MEKELLKVKWTRTQQQLKTVTVIIIIYFEAMEHFMYVSGFSCTSVASISVIGVVLSGYRSVPLFVHSGLTSPLMFVKLIQISSSSSKLLLYVTFRHKCSFK